MSETMYEVDGKEMSEETFWNEYLIEKFGLNFHLRFPKTRYYALEYGEPMPKNKHTWNIIHKALIDEMNLSGDELERATKQWYNYYTDRHVPRPFKIAIVEAWGTLSNAQKINGGFKKAVRDNLKKRLKDYNNTGVCTLGLAKYVVIHRNKEESLKND